MVAFAKQYEALGTEFDYLIIHGADTIMKYVRIRLGQIGVTTL